MPQPSGRKHNYLLLRLRALRKHKYQSLRTGEISSSSSSSPFLVEAQRVRLCIPAHPVLHGRPVTKISLWLGSPAPVGGRIAGRGLLAGAGRAAPDYRTRIRHRPGSLPSPRNPVQLGRILGGMDPAAPPALLHPGPRCPPQAPGGNRTGHWRGLVGVARAGRPPFTGGAGSARGLRGRPGQHGNYGRPNSQVSGLGATLGLGYRMTGDARYAAKLKTALLHYGGLKRWAGDVGWEPPWHSELNTARFCHAQPP